MATSNEAGDQNAMAQTTIDDLDTRRRRIRYRAWHRGTREMDLVLGPFADAFVPAMPIEDLDRLEVLMNEDDIDLLKWVMGQESPPGTIDIQYLTRLIAFKTKDAALK